MTLRQYQRDFISRVYAAWQDPNCRNVMGVLPTGAGKTTCFTSMLSEMNRPACVVAHRNELVSQAALALNRDGVPHGIVAPKAVIQQIIRLEMETHGKSLYSARAPVRAAGVNTLAVRDASDRWFQQVEYVVMDEGHHVLRENVFGKAVSLFPNARGLFPTAHAIRADGAGLGRSADGLVDALVVGPSGRDLIRQGMLTDYRWCEPPTDIDVSDVPISPTGDFSGPKLRAAVHKSKTIVGDIVTHYLRFAAGKLGVTFVVDVEAAGEVAAAYRARGVPAEVITAKTPIAIRAQLMRKFRERKILQLVSVDVLGEGVDVPAIEVVSLARHTASFQLFSQQIGRGLRLMVSPELQSVWDTLTDEQRLAHIAASVKPKAMIIDHVGNRQRHGFPDVPRSYTLDRRERRSKSAPDAIPLRVCINPECLQPFERIYSTCPHCGAAVPAPTGRGTPEMVDGDLIELDPATLAALRGEIERIDGACRVPANAAPHVAKAIHANHIERQAAQHTLRHSIALWAGFQRLSGRDDRECQRLFFHQYGVDVATAQTLNVKDAELLNLRVSQFLTAHNIVEVNP